MEILSRYDRKRKFYRLKNGDFVNMEENGLESLQEVRQALQLTDKQLMQDKIEVPAYRMLYLDETLQENAMMEVTLQNDLSHSVERRFGRIDLGQHIFTGDILLHHTVNRLHLSDNFFQSSVQVFCIHTLSHDRPPVLF